jgi:hypothetical protein
VMVSSCGREALAEQATKLSNAIAVKSSCRAEEVENCFMTGHSKA